MNATVEIRVQVLHLTRFLSQALLIEQFDESHHIVVLHTVVLIDEAIHAVSLIVHICGDDAEIGDVS